MSNGIENQLIDSFVAEDESSIFSPNLFQSFVDLWKDSNKRIEYERLKGDLGEKYMTDPAKYLGFIEESEDLHVDVIAAADETGVDPNFLYNVAMQEGMAKKMSLIQKAREGTEGNLEEFATVYESDRPLNSFSDIGLDTIFLEQDTILARGYLDNPIKPDPNNPVYQYTGKQDDQGQWIYEETPIVTGQNEKGLEMSYANITSADAFRGTGALIKLNQDYMINSFNKEGLDFNSIPKEMQQFWTYASFNAGAGTTEELLKAYGPDLFNNPDFVERIEIYNTTRDDDLFLKHEKLALWMENVGRVVGGTELTNLYSPFSGGL